MLRKVSVSLNETPDKKVTPAKDSLLLKELTVTSRASPSIEGTKHSILDISDQSLQLNTNLINMFLILVTTATL
jgi:hypothetical protein